jgi:Zinc finger, C2H2 type
VLATIHVCEVCHDLFPSQSAVRQHLRTCVKTGRQLEVVAAAPKIEPPDQDDPRLFLCGNCGNYFASRSELAEHVKGHAASLAPKVEKNIPIVTSGISTLELKAHTFSYDCNHCGAPFKTMSLMKEHAEKHTPQRNGIFLHCIRPHCKFVSLNSSVLRRHVAWHDKKMRFVCDVPDCLFSTDCCNSLRQHVIRVHGDGFECHLCGHICSTKNNLSVHLKKHETSEKKS